MGAGANASGVTARVMSGIGARAASPKGRALLDRGGALATTTAARMTGVIRASGVSGAAARVSAVATASANSIGGGLATRLRKSDKARHFPTATGIVFAEIDCKHYNPSAVVALFLFLFCLKRKGYVEGV